MHVSGLFIYPVKSVRSVPLRRAEVRHRGLAGDRRWVVVDEHGQFLSQRSHARLALVSAAAQSDGSITLDAPGMPSLHVAVPAGTPRRTVTVWDDTLDAAVGDPTAGQWFSEFLGSTCQLVYMDQASLRPVAPAYGRPGDVVSFADAAPLLLATEASLADLNQRMARPLPMSRFRPNVIVAGNQPWEEDQWKLLRIGNVEFEVTHGCARCVMTTIDQDTSDASSDGEPLKTLATFRRFPDGVHFGQNLIPRTMGTISVDDAVEVIEIATPSVE